MSRPSQVTARALALAVSVSLLVPATGVAHALFGDRDPNRPALEYLWLGFGHMVGGYDHLLFVVGVVLLAGALRPAAKMISLFAAGHSLTLLVATLAGWQLNATGVDVVIALSLAYVGIQGLRFGRPENLRVFGTVVFGFGLVHGLGLSTRLQALGLPEDGLVIRVLLFNVGVEVGQLVALSIIVGIGTLVARRWRGATDVPRYAYGGLIAAGLLAAAIISFPSEAPEDPTQASATATPAAAVNGPACTAQPQTPPRFIGGGHPEKFFFGPQESAPNEDLVHVIGDGYVIVRYRPDLSTEQQAELQQLVATSNPQAVVAAPDPEQSEPIKAITFERTLTCTKPVVDELATFRDEWFAQLRAQQGG